MRTMWKIHRFAELDQSQLIFLLWNCKSKLIFCSKIHFSSKLAKQMLNFPLHFKQKTIYFSLEAPFSLQFSHHCDNFIIANNCKFPWTCDAIAHFSPLIRSPFQLNAFIPICSTLHPNVCVCVVVAGMSSGGAHNTHGARADQQQRKQSFCRKLVLN